MKHWMTFAATVFGLVVVCTPLRAQSSVNGVRIYTDPPGLEFTVDGDNYLSAADLMWPATSKHVVDTYDQLRTSGVQYIFSKIYTNLSELPVEGRQITADPALKWVRIVFDTSYSLTLDLPPCADAQTVCPTAVQIEVGEALYGRRTVLWMKAGESVHARAFPSSGYIFTGWGAVWALGRPTQYDITFPMTGPLVLTANVQVANTVNAQFNVVTDPPQLKVLLDRTPYYAPATLQWGWGTTHSIGLEPVQMVQGQMYVFRSWSDGGAVNHDIQIPSQTGPITLIAIFEPGVPVGFATTPPGLKLNIDTYQNSPVTDYYWASGTVHKISAPLTQTDAQGRNYRFVSWSNGQPAGWELTAGTTVVDGRIRAIYQLLGSATLATVPAGLPLQINGVNCDSPCSVERDAGTVIKVSAAPLRQTGERSRLAFQKWADSAQPDREITLGENRTTYTATYSLQNRLTVSATPTEGAVFQFDPRSPDGFYDSAALVTISVKVSAGFRIGGWSGDVSGASMAAALTLESPRNAVLTLDRIPAIAPLGVRNAASSAADHVTAGSIITIFGANLAPAPLAGPPNPLAQTLLGVTVRVDESSLLPLIFVSPAQINAQLPAALTDGPHKLTVSWGGKPDSTAQFVVARNSPGLFESNQTGSFLRVNGRAVTDDAPARPGEIITILGTGLGPYVSQPPDGFLFDETAGYTLLDEVSVVIGDGSVAKVLYAGRSGIAAGVDGVRFQLPSTLPSSSQVTVKLRVNGQESNIVLLPITQ